MQEKTSYLLGSELSEIERLQFQHRLLAPITTDLWERSKIHIGDRILDLGSGPGFASLELAELVTKKGRVTAFDSSSDYLKFLKNRIEKLEVENLECVQKDISNVADLSCEYDHVFSRFFWIFQKNIPHLLDQLLKVIRPGARFSLLEFYDYPARNLYFPSTPRLEKVFDADALILADTGEFGLNVGKSLVYLLSQKGFEIELQEPVIKTARRGEPLWHWQESFYREFNQTLVQKGYISTADNEAFWVDWEGLTNDPDAFCLSCPLMKIIARKK